MWLHIHLATVVRNVSGITTTVAAFSYVCVCIITAISTVSLHIVRAPPPSNFACCLLSLFLLLLCLAHTRTAAWKSRSNSYINYTNNSNYNCHKEHGDFSTQLPIAVVVFLLPSTKRPQHAPAHLIAGKGVTTATCFFFSRLQTGAIYMRTRAAFEKLWLVFHQDWHLFIRYCHLQR